MVRTTVVLAPTPFVRLVAIALCALTSACSCRSESTLVPDAQVDAMSDAMSDAADPNLAPIANAGPDAMYLIGAAFSLDGTASNDPDGVVIGFQWTVDTRPVGSTATVTNAAASMASFTPDKAGTYVFELMVTDDGGATDRDTVMVVVEPGTFTVDAGPDQTVVWWRTVQLAGSYVCESGPGTVKWRLLSQPNSASPVPIAGTSLNPTFFVSLVGNYVAELEVTCPAGTATDTVTVTVVAPPPELIAGDIVDIDPGHYSGQFAIASVNPSRLRLLAPVWPTPPLEMIIPLTVTPTAIGFSETEEFISVIHDSTRLTVASAPGLAQLSTMNTATPLLDVRHGSATPRAYPAQAGPLLLIDYQNAAVYPGGLVPGPSRGREYSSAERPLYALDIGSSAKLRRFDASAQSTPLVREWPYPGGQYPLGDDLWLIPDAIVVSTGHVFNISETATLDMTHRGFLSGDQPFEIVGVVPIGTYVVTLHNRITTPMQLPETQVRFYNYMTLALEHVIALPDLIINSVPQRTLGLALTATTTPGRVYVIGRAGLTHALFTVPLP
jgi:hypothetical protein